MKQMSQAQQRRLERQRKIEEERAKAARDLAEQRGEIITDPEQLADEVQRLASVLGARVRTS